MAVLFIGYAAAMAWVHLYRKQIQYRYCQVSTMLGGLRLFTYFLNQFFPEHKTLSVHKKRKMGNFGTYVILYFYFNCGITRYISFERVSTIQERRIF
jgi:hypothetical protein